MPRGDGTGPSGQGSRTGRGLGTCIGTGIRRLFQGTRAVRRSPVSGEVRGIEPGLGQGIGLGRGQRAGRRGRRR